MAIWLDDLLEQIATSMALADSGNPTGKRLAFIIVDNAVEYLMKAYVENETQLIGSGKAIKKTDWDDLKENFKRLIAFVFKQFPSTTASQTDIQSYHDVRNSLYHEAKPISVEAKEVSKYIEQFKTLLNDLQKFKMSDDQWHKKAYDVSRMIARKEAQTKIVIKYSIENGLARFRTDAPLKDTEALMHGLHTFANYMGLEPTITDLERLLVMSGHPIEQSVIMKRLNHLKSTRMILKSKLLLDPKGLKKLKEKFVIIYE